jgi:hypothetical protein
MRRDGMNGRRRAQTLSARARSAHARRALAVAAAGMTLLLGACGGDDDSDDGLLEAQGPLAGCSALTEMPISSTSIALPSGGAVVHSARLVAADSEGNTNGEYCLVEGSIFPVSPDAPAIKFQANLPTAWNQRAVHMGGGGYNGTVVTGLGGVGGAPTPQTPLARGYVTFGSDSGHQSTQAQPSADASFAFNDEALENYGYAHIKKTRDAVVKVLEAYFGEDTGFKTYFAGFSTGGRESLTAVQRFPEDYDGAFVGAPTSNFWGIRMIGFPVGRASYAVPGGYVNPAKQTLVYERSLAACDSLDGVQDGIVSNLPACRAQSPNTIASLRCASGTDEGDSCLSDPQLAVIESMHNGLTLPYEMAFGSSRLPGYNVLEGTKFGLGSSPTIVEPPTAAENGYLFAQGVQWLRYFVVRDPNYDPLAFDPLNPGPLQDRVVELSGIIGAENPDLSAFQARGGKLIMMHGLADDLVSPNGSIAYYERVVDRLGQGAVDQFVRFYTVPGFGHGGGAFVPEWDALGALDAWVTTGTAPGVMIGTDRNSATAGRSRPLCLYPSWPRYNGTGGVNAASSYICTTS